MSLAILATSARCGCLLVGKASEKARLYSAFAPLVRLLILIAYAWAVFHKLNADFFHYPVSAAAQHYLQLVGRIGSLTGLHWFPTTDGALMAVVGMTFVSVICSGFIARGSDLQTVLQLDAAGMAWLLAKVVLLGCGMRILIIRRSIFTRS